MYVECKKKLHKLTPRNRTKDGRCVACRETYMHRRLRLKHKPRPSETGKCQKGLHDWIESNWIYEISGVIRCKACRHEAQRKYYDKRYRIACLVKGCRRRTMRRTGGTYICGIHRDNPPSWILKIGKIVGTQVCI